MQETIASRGALGYNILLILVKMGKIFVNKAIGNSHMLSYSLTYSILLSTSRQQRPGCQ